MLEYTRLVANSRKMRSLYQLENHIPVVGIDLGILKVFTEKIT